MIDRRLGGAGQKVNVDRASEIAQNVVDVVVKLLVESLTETWRDADRRSARNVTEDPDPSFVTNLLREMGGSRRRAQCRAGAGVEPCGCLRSGPGAVGSVCTI
jgi:hypothetical protein